MVEVKNWLLKVSSEFHIRAVPHTWIYNRYTDTNTNMQEEIGRKGQGEAEHIGTEGQRETETQRNNK